MEYSAFTSQNQITLDELPGCPGKSVVIRQLNGKRLRKASEAAQAAYIEQVKNLGGAAALKDVQSLQDTDPAAKQKALDDALEAQKKDPLAGMDRDEALVQGIVSWTFDVPLSRESVEDLNDTVGDYIAHRIVKLAKPDRTEEQEKNS